jgi:hypothetical protein
MRRSARVSPIGLTHIQLATENTQCVSSAQITRPVSTSSDTTEPPTSDKKDIVNERETSTAIEHIEAKPLAEAITSATPQQTSAQTSTQFFYHSNAITYASRKEKNLVLEKIATRRIVKQKELANKIANSCNMSKEELVNARKTFKENIPYGLLYQNSEQQWRIADKRGAENIPCDGIYAFVRSKIGFLRAIKPNAIQDSMHLICADYAGEVNYSGILRFDKGLLEWWSNDSGSYKPRSENFHQAGLPENCFIDEAKLPKVNLATFRPAP